MKRPQFARWNTEKFLREACDAIALDVDWDPAVHATKHGRSSAFALPRLKAIFAGLTMVTSPLGVLTLLFWTNAFLNPMATAYIDSFEVRNATLQPIEVTPLGKTGGGTAELKVLPLCSRTRPVLPDLEAVRRLVVPGATTHIVYDGDDVVPVAVVVEFPNVAPRALGVVPVRNGTYLVRIDAAA